MQGDTNSSHQFKYGNQDETSSTIKLIGSKETKLPASNMNFHDVFSAVSTVPISPKHFIIDPALKYDNDMLPKQRIQSDNPSRQNIYEGNTI